MQSDIKRPDEKPSDPTEKPQQPEPLQHQTPKAPPMSDDEAAGSGLPRRFFSGLTGFIAIAAFILFIPSYWLAQTFGNSEKFTSVTSSIIETNAVRDFIAQEISTQLVKETTPQELKEALGTTSQDTAQQEIQQRLTELLEKPEASALIKDSTRKIYTGLFESNGAQTVNLQPELERLLKLFEGSQLSFLAEMELEENAGIIKLDSEQATQAQNAHKRFNNSWIILLVVAIVGAILSVLLSRNHLRRITVISVWVFVVSATYLAMVLVTSRVPVGGDDPKLSQALQDVIGQSLNSLQALCTVLVISALVVGIGAQLLNRRQNSQRKQIEKI